MLFSLIENLEKVDIILASTSPRRYELLQNLGLSFKVVPSEVKENQQLDTNPIDGVRENALKKGRWVSANYPDHLVIAADTIVVLGQKVMGKPADEQDAYRMLAELSGKTHQVYTAIGLFFERYNQSQMDIVSTDVTFRELTGDEIWAYINTGEPFDKAGAYAIQGQGSVLIDRINGCYFNVVGFPLSRFFLLLDQFLGKFVL